ncbi:MAG: helix-turn-helix transcriptional regulator [Anaerocolumna aminovalerica]|uniref:helix-turn-helix domain-containing protein n=1 Tax=Anaerocolumna aminovalerica TaxID=1527 RepID=UPI002914E4BF|nr:helix-turn-helix transcriptional regulator [Anaerocolumna aminovalerica]MDU6263694.1 helix-turn-helix transcriptional regulator [Anaerocolumna aminovalerica]
MSNGYRIAPLVKVSKLKKARILRGLTQAQLSELSGVPTKCIGNYEQNRRDLNNAKAIIVYRLASALGCDMVELLDT